MASLSASAATVVVGDTTALSRGERRRLRLLQVREQERELSAQRRIAHDNKKAVQRAADRQTEMRKAEAEARAKEQRLEAEYLACVSHYGEGHRQAAEAAEEEWLLAREQAQREADKRTRERARNAQRRLQAERRERTDTQNAPRNNLARARAREQRRAAAVAAQQREDAQRREAERRRIAAEEAAQPSARVLPGSVQAFAHTFHHREHKKDELGAYTVQRAGEQHSGLDARLTATLQVELEAQTAESKAAAQRTSRRIALQRGQAAAHQLRLQQARDALERDLAVADQHEKQQRKYTVSQPEHTVIQAREKRLLERGKQHHLERALEDLMLQARDMDSARVTRGRDKAFTDEESGLSDNGADSSSAGASPETRVASSKTTNVQQSASGRQRLATTDYTQGDDDVQAVPAPNPRPQPPPQPAVRPLSPPTPVHHAPQLIQQRLPAAGEVGTRLTSILKRPVHSGDTSAAGRTAPSPPPSQPQSQQQPAAAVPKIATDGRDALDAMDVHSVSDEEPGTQPSGRPRVHFAAAPAQQQQHQLPLPSVRTRLGDSNSAWEVVTPASPTAHQPAAVETWYATHGERVSSTSSGSPPPVVRETAAPSSAPMGTQSVRMDATAVPAGLRWSTAASDDDGVSGDNAALEAEWFHLLFRPRSESHTVEDPPAAHVPSPRLAALQTEVRRLAAVAHHGRRGEDARVADDRNIEQDEDDEEGEEEYRVGSTPADVPVAWQQSRYDAQSARVAAQQTGLTSSHDYARHPPGAASASAMPAHAADLDSDVGSDEGTASFLERVVGHRRAEPNSMYPPLMAHHRTGASDSASTSTQHVLTALDVLQSRGEVHRGHVLPAHRRLAALGLASQDAGAPPAARDAEDPTESSEDEHVSGGKRAGFLRAQARHMHRAPQPAASGPPHPALRLGQQRAEQRQQARREVARAGELPEGPPALRPYAERPRMTADEVLAVNRRLREKLCAEEREPHEDTAAQLEEKRKLRARVRQYDQSVRMRRGGGSGRR